MLTLHICHVKYKYKSENGPPKMKHEFFDKKQQRKNKEW